LAQEFPDRRPRVGASGEAEQVGGVVLDVRVDAFRERIRVEMALISVNMAALAFSIQLI